MKRYLSHLLLLWCSMLIGISTSYAQHKSFVQQEIVKVPGVFTEAQLSGLSTAQKQVTRTYTDGFGRAQQVIAVGGSPNGKDLVQHRSYDNMGRESIGYLPYASANNNGAFRANALGEQTSFYNTSGQKTATDANPFSQQLFENSPLQRVLRQGSVGAGFQPGEHDKILAYGTNTNAETVRRWQPDGSDAGTWPVGTLNVTTITDESGAKAAVYTDAAGQTILKRQWFGQGGVSWLNTYYVYDDLGQLLFIIPPKATAFMETVGNYSLVQTELAKLIFSYVYDEKGRPIARTVPGGTPVYMVYDRMDRMILVQDGNLRAQGKWNYIKYDSRQTPISQGIYTDGNSRAALQAYVLGLNYSNGYFEVRNGDAATGYYSNNTFPTVNLEPLAYSYFDDYDLDGNGAADFAFQAQGLGEGQVSENIAGLPTVVRKRTVGNGLSNIWLSSVMFYDRKGQLIQTRSNNQLDVNLASVKTFVRDFTGKTTLTKISHSAATTVTIQTAYAFDHMDRLKTVDESYNGAAAIRVAAYEYNELGQLVDKKLHSTNGGGSYLQSVDYRYNIRGQLTSLNNSTLTVDSRNDDANDVFGLELLYEQTDGSLGNTGYYNGLLSAVKWKTNAPGVTNSNERSYRFNYDALLRLTAANYADRAAGNGWGSIGAFDEKNISYDLNGNILSLQRNAILNGNITAVDDLTYSYDGNRLNNVSDGSGGNYNVFGFKNLTGSADAYNYADNGNLMADTKKGLALTYNVLNRTERVTITNAAGRYIDYTYGADGALIRKQAIDNGSLVKTTDYIDGFVYENGILAYFGSSGGRVRNNSGSLKPEYIIQDQQGNARVSFEEQNGVAVVRQENSYYPFGLSMPGNTLPTAANKKLYNGGAEWQDDFGDMPDLQQTFYRMYDPALGRFIAVDPIAEASESLTGYQYALNNPVIFNDPLGDKAANTVTGQYADFWNSALSYTKGYGASWNSESGFSAFGSSLEGFTKGAGLMSENGTWGMNGWAQDYESAAQAFYDKTGTLALQPDKYGYIVTGFYFRDGQGKPIIKNGVSGEYSRIFVGKEKNTRRPAGSEKEGIDKRGAIDATIGIIGGVAEVILGVGGEAFTAGISTAMIIDGVYRIGMNTARLTAYLTANKEVGNALPSNLGGMVGKLIDRGKFSEVGKMQIALGATNDIATFFMTGGNGSAWELLLRSPNSLNGAASLVGITSNLYTVGNYGNWGQK
ncbi:DUF6443 domain-containing protein [Pedobacter sp. GSP4]|uniref:DUF6443 domain-containing protein n=1 Tax=Pedobacter sp. GSP4 TaxID=3453716 RepID=UPI003EEEF3EA